MFYSVVIDCFFFKDPLDIVLPEHADLNDGSNHGKLVSTILATQKELVGTTHVETEVISGFWFVFCRCTTEQQKYNNLYQFCCTRIGTTEGTAVLDVSN